MAYKSSYTGPQIDQAVGNALIKDTTTLSNDVNHIPASSVVKSAINALTPALYTASVTTNQYGVVTTDLPASAILLDYWTTSRNFIFVYKSADNHWAFGLCDVGTNNNLVMLPNYTTGLGLHYISP